MISDDAVSLFRNNNALCLLIDNDVLSFVMGDDASYVTTGDNALSVLMDDNVSYFSTVTRRCRLGFELEEPKERYSTYLY